KIFEELLENSKHEELVLKCFCYLLKQDLLLYEKKEQNDMLKLILFEIDKELQLDNSSFSDKYLKTFKKFQKGIINSIWVTIDGYKKVLRILDKINFKDNDYSNDESQDTDSLNSSSSYECYEDSNNSSKEDEDDMQKRKNLLRNLKNTCTHINKIVEWKIDGYDVLNEIFQNIKKDSIENFSHDCPLMSLNGTYEHEIGSFFDVLLNFNDVQVAWNEEESEASKERVISTTNDRVYGHKPDFQVLYYLQFETYELAFCEISGVPELVDTKKFNADKNKLCRFGSDAKARMLKKIYDIDSGYFYKNLQNLLKIPIMLIQVYQAMVDLSSNNIYSPIGSFILLDEIEYFFEKQTELYQIDFITKLLKVRESVKKTLSEIKLHFNEATLQVTKPPWQIARINYNVVLTTPN
ncbi:5187_t:CDS:2, partial [Entrophospora sp. SA101]